MKKRFCAVMCAAIMLTLAGCVSPYRIAKEVTNDIVSDITGSINIDEAGNTRAKKEIRVFSAESGSRLRTVTDTEIIVEYVLDTTNIIVQQAIHEQMRRRKSYSIPTGAVQCYVYEVWEEDMRGDKPAEDSPYYHVYDTTLYQDNDGYYVTVELLGIMRDALEGFFENGRFHAAVSDETGEYLIRLAQGEPHPETFGGEGPDAPDDSGADSAQSYLEGRIGVDYEGVARVSQNQRIEILSAQEGKLVYSITDLQDIAGFLNRQNAGEWEYAGALPSDAEKICDIIRYAQSRNTNEIELTEQYRDILYRAASGYFIEVVIAQNGLDMPNAGLVPLCFMVPDETGGYLESLC